MHRAAAAKWGMLRDLVLSSVKGSLAEAQKQREVVTALQQAAEAAREGRELDAGGSQALMDLADPARQQEGAREALQELVRMMGLPPDAAAAPADSDEAAEAAQAEAAQQHAARLSQQFLGAAAEISSNRSSSQFVSTKADSILDGAAVSHLVETVRLAQLAKQWRARTARASEKAQAARDLAGALEAQAQKLEDDAVQLEEQALHDEQVGRPEDAAREMAQAESLHRSAEGLRLQADAENRNAAQWEAQSLRASQQATTLVRQSLTLDRAAKALQDAVQAAPEQEQHELGPSQEYAGSSPASLRPSLAGAGPTAGQLARVPSLASAGPTAGQSARVPSFAGAAPNDGQLAWMPSLADAASTAVQLARGSSLAGAGSKAGQFSQRPSLAGAGFAAGRLARAADAADVQPLGVAGAVTRQSLAGVYGAGTQSLGGADPMLAQSLPGSDSAGVHQGSRVSLTAAAAQPEGHDRASWPGSLVSQSQPGTAMDQDHSAEDQSYAASGPPQPDLTSLQQDAVLLDATASRLKDAVRRSSLWSAHSQWRQQQQQDNADASQADEHSHAGARGDLLLDIPADSFVAAAPLPSTAGQQQTAVGIGGVDIASVLDQLPR